MARDLIDKFKETNVLIIGDVMIDEYIYGEANRISPEAPVPIIDFEEIIVVPGGAGNVAKNIADLAGPQSPFICSAVGRGGHRLHLEYALDELNNINTIGLCDDHTRITTKKTRVIAGNQQIVRIDEEDTHPINDDIVDYMIRTIGKVVADMDAVIISDYGKGVVTQPLMDKLMPIFKDNKLIMVVDPKVDNFECYKGAACITPNHHEAGYYVGYNIENDETLESAGKTILKELNCESVLITRGKDGMALFEGNKVTHIPTYAKKVYDVSGAGDTVVAVFTLCLAIGIDKATAARIANVAAGIVVGELGTSSVNFQTLKDSLHENNIY